jgi:predicted dehydrogenase
VELGVNLPQLTLYRNGESGPRGVEPPPPRPGGYLDAFLAEVRGEAPAEGRLTSADALQAARVSLRIQQAADQAACHVPLGAR